MLAFLTLLSSGLLTLLAQAQFVPEPKDFKTAKGHAAVAVRYKEVPASICDVDSDRKSYSGYADISEHEHLFFWFFETRKGDPTKSPLTVWINGGPGTPSLKGLFQGTGPCSVDNTGYPYSNPHSWSSVSNLLVIDQPNLVGLSYSDPVNGYTNDATGISVTLPEAKCPGYTGTTCSTFAYSDAATSANSTANAAPSFWKALQAFIGAFPQYPSTGIHLASESYGGHWLPIFGDYLLDMNAKKLPGTVPIELESVTIGNPWLDPIIQYASLYNFTVSPGNTYDYNPLSADQAARMHNGLYGRGNCIDRLQACKASGRDDHCASAVEFCTEHVYDIMTGRDPLDIRQPSEDPFPYTFYRKYLNTAPVQQALGAYVNYSETSDSAGSFFSYTGDLARESGSVEAIRRLLAANVTVGLLAGDADYDCNWLGVEAVADVIQGDNANWHAAGYTDLATSDGRKNGQTRQAGRFSFTRLYYSGHQFAFYQPLAALEVFERVIKGTDVATGKHKVGPRSKYKTEGPPGSSFREGNATVQLHALSYNLTYDTKKHVPGDPWPQRRRRKNTR